VKAYFDRTKTYYLSKEPSYDGVQVDVAEKILDVLQDRQDTIELMELAIIDAGAPEDSAQDLTDTFVDLLATEERITDG